MQRLTLVLRSSIVALALGSAAIAAPSIVASAAAGAGALDLSAGAHVVKVADLVFETTGQHGLTLSVSPGDLSKPGGTSIPFQVQTVSAGGAPGAFSEGVHTFATDAAGSSAHDLYIRYAPAALQDPGAYGGTLELTVADNP